MSKFICIILILFLFCGISFADEKDISLCKYKKSQVIKLDDFLYAKDSPNNWKKLKINKNGDVVYKQKVIITDSGQPINDNTASESYLLLKILLIATGAEPREDCDESDYYNNGIYGLGCYTFEDSE